MHEAQNDLERGVLRAIDMDEMLSFLDRLVAIPSVSDHETPAQECMADVMQDIGFDVDVWEIDFDTLRRHPTYSVDVERSCGLGVVGSMGGDGPRLVLNGHVDVVPPGSAEGWTHPPWRATVDAGRVYGRGALDMKGGLCCGLFATKAIRDAGVDLDGKILLQSVIGEEDGGAGTLAAILRGHTGDAAIIMEPTDSAIVTAQAGALSFRISIPGCAAHGAVRETGVSAIEKWSPVHSALLALERERNDSVRDARFQRYALPYALSIGTIHGGSWPSSVPDAVTIEGRYGVALGEDLAAARAALENAVARAARQDDWLRDHPPRVEWWGAQFEPAETSPDHPVVHTLAEAYREVAGSPATFEGVPYGSDMRLLVNVGHTPTVLFGPGDVRNAHADDEFVPLEDLRTVTRTLALTALRFCGVRDTHG